MQTINQTPAQTTSQAPPQAQPTATGDDDIWTSPTAKPELFQKRLEFMKNGHPKAARTNKVVWLKELERYEFKTMMTNIKVGSLVVKGDGPPPAKKARASKGLTINQINDHLDSQQSAMKMDARYLNYLRNKLSFLDVAFSPSDDWDQLYQLTEGPTFCDDNDQDLQGLISARPIQVGDGANTSANVFQLLRYELGRARAVYGSTGEDDSDGQSRPEMSSIPKIPTGPWFGDSSYAACLSKLVQDRSLNTTPGANQRTDILQLLRYELLKARERFDPSFEFPNLAETADNPVPNQGSLQVKSSTPNSNSHQFWKQLRSGRTVTLSEASYYIDRLLNVARSVNM